MVRTDRAELLKGKLDDSRVTPLVRVRLTCLQSVLARKLYDIYGAV